MPPDFIFLSVAMDDILKPVDTDTTCAIIIMPITINSVPEFPTTHPNRRYMITPRIVRIEGINTPPNVPNFFMLSFVFQCHQLSSANLTTFSFLDIVIITDTIRDR